jgi:response regulator of citrate/malate metabolism
MIPTESLIMLIDDSPIDNYINTRMIEQAALTKNILVMETVQKALKYIRDVEVDERKLPDLVLLDLNMPVVNGFNFLNEFKSFPENIRKKCKIIVLTSSDKTEDIHNIINNPLVKRYMIKPLSQESLDDLKKLLG